MDEDGLQRYLIKGAPPSMYYMPNFITEDEQSTILSKIPPNQWISLSRRRLQALPAQLTGSNALIASKGLPDWLVKPTVQRIHDLGVFKSSPHGGVNHCLINEYLPGQGIMPHEDGAAYYPVVATVSLGGSIVLDVTSKPDHNSSNNSEEASSVGKHLRILQEPRSLLLTTGSAYTDTLHGISEVYEDLELTSDTVANWELLADPRKIADDEGKNKRETRISLTLRDVLKVSALGSKIFGKQRG